MAARALDPIQPLNISQTHSVCLNLPPNNQRVNYWPVLVSPSQPPPRFCINKLKFLYKYVVFSLQRGDFFSDFIKLMLKVWKKTGCRPTWAPFLWVTLGLRQRKTHFGSLAPSSGLDSPARTPPPHACMCKSRRLDTSEPEACFSRLILCLTSKAGPRFDSLLFRALACARVCFKLLPDLEDKCSL